MLLGLLLIGAVVFAACGDDDDDDATPTATSVVADADHDDADDHDAAGVTVSLEDFAVVLDVDSAGAGEVTFEVANDGATLHNFLVIRTDLATDDLPLDGAAVDEDAVDVVGRTGDIASGETETVAVSLDAGSYVLICNIPGHVQLGMTVALTIE
jgi:azurin